MMNGVRKALLAGTWYPASGRELRHQIEAWAGEVSLKGVELEGSLQAIVAPHAGIAYSGRVAACAWKAATGYSWDAVILIGPSHRVRFQGASISACEGYESPLGVLPIDSDLSDRLAARDRRLWRVSDDRVPENSLELHVPFIQVMLPGVPFVPVMMGTQDRETCEALAEAIVDSLGDGRVLVAASSDLSHYLGYEEAVAMDRKTLGFIERGDRDGLLAAIGSSESEACGAGPIAVTMAVARARGCDRIRVFDYINSGDVAGDKSGVVGYGAVGFFSTETRVPGASEEKGSLSDFSEGHERPLGTEEKKALLFIAKRSIESAIEDGSPVQEVQELPEPLREPGGAFVTLKKRGRLRGCIGFIKPTRPLFQVVADAARSAALDDPRFAPLEKGDFGDLDIEISVLSPLRAISDVNDIEIGRHGLYIVKGSNTGLLLPQVAVENGWDRVTFLEETCCKAGLPRGAWKDADSAINVFSAEIIGESH